MAGLDGKIQLAMLTRIPSTRALIEPDSSENVAKFDQAMQALRSKTAAGQGNARPSMPLPGSAPTNARQFTSGGEELFWGVLGSLHDAMVAVYEANGHCALAWESRSLERRYPAPEGGRSVRETVARELGQRFQHELRAVHEGGQQFHGEVELDVHGQKASFAVTFSAGYDQGGRVLGVNAFIQDISDRKRHERALSLGEARLREQTRVYVELVARKAALLSDVALTLQSVTEALAKTLGVARASVWLYDEQKTKIRCADLFEAAQGSHTRDMELEASQFPSYFAALGDERTLAAHDAHQDPRTACFSAPYLTPLGIGAMLDVPIWCAGQMIGVVCNEHVGGPRLWTPDEENFAYLLASYVAMAKEREQLKRGQ